MQNPSLIVALGLVAHLVGDYLLQSTWMARNKAERWWPAIAHGTTYALPFALLTRSLLALLVIGATHAAIDHYQVGRYVSWARDQLAPAGERPPASAILAAPVGVAVGVGIVVDNTLHVLVNTTTLLLIGGPHV